MVINWKKVTIGQFDQLAEIKSNDPFKLKLQQIAILEGLEIEDVMAWDVEDVQAFDVNAPMPKRRLRFYFFHNNKYYRLPKNAKKIKAAQFIDLQTSDGTIAMNLSILSQRVNIWGKVIPEDITERIEEFKTIPVYKIKPYSDFFLRLYPLLLEATHAYLKQTMKEVKEMDNELTPMQ